MRSPAVRINSTSPACALACASASRICAGVSTCMLCDLAALENDDRRGNRRAVRDRQMHRRHPAQTDELRSIAEKTYDRLAAALVRHADAAPGNGVPEGLARGFLRCKEPGE